MTEIELKAHISDPDAAEKAVLALPGALKIGESVKQDVYLRLREARYGYASGMKTTQSPSPTNARKRGMVSR